MSNEQCSPEALAQAREQLREKMRMTVDEFDAHERDGGWTRATLAEVVSERATVLELRRQLARVTERCKERVGEALELRRENDKLLEEWHTALAELATERQRLEESESDRRTQYCRADAAERLLATERQRAEAAERSRDVWHDRACKDAAGWKSTEVRLEASEKRADAAEAQLSEWVNWFQQKDPAKAYDIIANEHDAIRSARDQWHRDYCQASEERSDYQGKLTASEAKRKALREAADAVVTEWEAGRQPIADPLNGLIYALRDAAADGKDTTPEETCMRGVRDDSEHYT